MMILIEFEGKHTVCQLCIEKYLSFEHWGIEVHRIAGKWKLEEWLVDKIKNNE